MTIQIRMPAFSSTMETGKLVKWLVEEGARVDKGQVIAEVETDKAIAEVEAPSAGHLSRILVPAGDEDIVVNAPIAELTAAGAAGGGGTATGAGEAGQAREATRDRAPTEAPATPVAGTGDGGAASGRRVAASPAARHAARAAGVELAEIGGSGPGGRIVKADVLAFAEKSETLKGAAPRKTDRTARETTLRQAIARAMVASKTTVPHFYAETEIVVDELVETKDRIAAAASGERITLTAFLVAAVARALRDIPDANCRWEDGSIVRQDACDVGVAVAVAGGVVVPVVRQADTLSVRQLAARLAALGAAARDDSLRQVDLGNASVTLSNLGMFGIDRFYPVINPPEPLIIGIGQARRVPYVVDDLLGIRTVMSCTLAVDHRVVDGALAGSFAGALKRFLEQPELLVEAGRH